MFFTIVYRVNLSSDCVQTREEKDGVIVLYRNGAKIRLQLQLFEALSKTPILGLGNIKDDVDFSGYRKTLGQLSFDLKEVLGALNCEISGSFACSYGKKALASASLQEATTVQLRLESVCPYLIDGLGRVVQQHYRLQAADGTGVVICSEKLTEGSYTFNIPHQLVSYAAENESRWKEYLESELEILKSELEQANPKDSKVRASCLQEFTDGLKRIRTGIEDTQHEIRLSQESLTQLNELKSVYKDYQLGNRTPSFKPSRQKKNSELAWIPTNLHRQQFSVDIVTCNRPQGSLVPGGADIRLPRSLSARQIETVTVGAFAAHTLRFKRGGIGGDSRLLSRLYDPIMSHKVESKKIPNFKVLNKISQLEFALDRRKNFVWSQSLTALTTAFCAHIIRHLAVDDDDSERVPGTTEDGGDQKLEKLGKDGLQGPQVLELQASIGFLIQVESLLSTFQSETGMLEDHQYGVSRMRNVRFRCARGQADVTNVGELHNLKATIVSTSSSSSLCPATIQITLPEPATNVTCPPHSSNSIPLSSGDPTCRTLPAKSSSTNSNNHLVQNSSVTTKEPLGTDSSTSHAAPGASRRHTARKSFLNIPARAEKRLSWIAPFAPGGSHLPMALSEDTDGLLDVLAEEEEEEEEEMKKADQEDREEENFSRAVGEISTTGTGVSGKAESTVLHSPLLAMELEGHIGVTEASTANIGIQVRSREGGRFDLGAYPRATLSGTWGLTNNENQLLDETSIRSSADSYGSTMAGFTEASQPLGNAGFRDRPHHSGQGPNGGFDQVKTLKKFTRTMDTLFWSMWSS